MRMICAAAVLVLSCAPVVAAPDVVTVEHVQSFSGEVVIRTEESRIVIMVDTDRGERDGLVDQWFFLDLPEEISPLSAHLRAVHIVHTPGNLRVASRESRVLYDFVVAGYERANEVPQDFRAVRVVGIGLSHNTGETKIRLLPNERGGGVTTQCEICDPLEPDPGTGGGAGGSCDAGGSGSVSCSASTGTYSCSVSCSAGYYSCCNVVVGGVSCKCIKS